MFEKAIKQKLRFDSVRGQLTTEDLWDLPLTSRNSFDLDTIAKAVNSKIKEAQEESFVKVRSNPAQDKLTLQLDILKYIIADKMQEAETKATTVARQQQRQKLEEVLASKQDDALKGLSVEELQAQINALKA